MKNFSLRRAGQWLLLSVLVYFWLRTIFSEDFYFNFEACCPYGGLQAIATFFSNGALACSMDGMQVFMGGLLALTAILVSKLFCGHVCPIGTISEGLGRLGKKFKIRRFEIGGIYDILLRSLKYVLVFITFYFALKTNDLACKTFDPFYASFSLFGEDVVVWLAILSILLLAAGAIFFRQFWCRYLCPLGAISNAFKYFYVFVAFAVIFILLHQAEVEIDLVIILALLSALAYTLEIIGLRKKAGLQVLRITRNTDLCTDCGICDKRCPQGIKVSKLKVVNHPDCNLCTECMGHCPKDEAIGINGSTKFRWLPTMITVVIVMVGFSFGTRMIIPTVDMKWGTAEEMQRSAVFEMVGLKNVKCYGSSMSFVNEVKKVPGITGAATYIRDHRVSLHYDSTRMTAEDVKRSLFKPTFLDIREPDNDAEVRIFDFYVENFFDQLDAVFLANLAKEDTSIYSFQTVYGDPVKVRVYTDANFTPESFSERIENSDLVYKTAEESFSSKGLYSISRIHESDTLFSGLYLKSMSFPAFKRAFNNRSKYSNDQLASLVFPIKSYPKNQQLMPYLVNHLGKADPYIVGLIAQYTSSGPKAVVFYVKGKTHPEKIADLMFNKELTVSYDNGETEKFPNPYAFEMPEILKKKLSSAKPGGTRLRDEEDAHNTLN